MFIEKFDSKIIEKYKIYLRCIGMLSKLSSESDAPYINSRIAENTFCLVTGSENLGRADCSADAKCDNVGIGIKTFLGKNNNTMQKVAEFNKDASMFRYKSAEAIVEIVAKLRNERILSTKRIYGLTEMLYHCIVREPGTIRICECAMDLIDTQNIKNITSNNNDTVVYFDDGLNEYSFNLNKNTLYKRFDTSNELLSVEVTIANNPYEKLLQLLGSEMTLDEEFEVETYASVILPLFSDKGGRNVPERSGLNQWNAAGRPRDVNEIYIPVPAWIHRAFPDFFPGRDEPFILKLPNGSELSAKLCQQGSKALMSNPNLELGKWLLREVMDLKEGELLTYEKLRVLGIDSVEVYKINNQEYKIDFRPLETYDIFLEEHNV